MLHREHIRLSHLHPVHAGPQYANPRLYDYVRKILSITGVRSSFAPPNCVPSEASARKGISLSYEERLEEAMLGFGAAAEQLLAKTGAPPEFIGGPMQGRGLRAPVCCWLSVVRCLSGCQR